MVKWRWNSHQNQKTELKEHLLGSEMLLLLMLLSFFQENTIRDEDIT